MIIYIFLIECRIIYASNYIIPKSPDHDEELKRVNRKKNGHPSGVIDFITCNYQKLLRTVV